MFKAKQTNQVTKVNQFAAFQLSTQQALKVKGGTDGSEGGIIIEDDIID